MRSLFSKHPHRVLGIGLLLALGVATFGSLIVAAHTRGTVRRAEEALIRSAAQIVAGEPDRAGPVARSLTEPEAPADLEAARRELARYGVTADILPIAGPFAGLVRTAAVLGFAVAAVSVLTTGCFAAAALSRLLAAVESVARNAEEIAAGKYSLSPGGEEEGSVARLEHQIHRTAHRLSAEAQAADAERNRTAEFLADISHQIKTPIASVRMYLELVLQSPERRDFVERGLTQIDRIDWLIRNLLTIERIQAGTLLLDFVTDPLDAMLQDVHQLHTPIAEAAGVRLDLALPEGSHRADPPHDPRWLGEAVGNIVKNAVDHSPFGETVTVALKRTNLFARIEIDDNGPGIAVEDLPHVFDRFYMGRTAKEGTGIGLALAKAVVEKHGGHIAAVPRRTGARFLVTLPYKSVSEVVTKS